MRGTAHGGFDAIHVVSAWSQAQGITLAALESSGKSNEIKTIPKLLDIINIKGATVTTDAMGCQCAIASKIRQQEGDYALQLKNNQANLLNEIKAYHHKLERDGYGDIQHEQHEEVDKGHGRLEQRRYLHFELSDWVACAQDWEDARSVIWVQRSRTTAKGEITETALAVSQCEAGRDSG